MDKSSLYVSFVKRNDEEQIVEGFASTEALDSQGEIVKSEALEKALPDYMQFANIREMHQWSAVGKAVSAEIDKTKKGLYLVAKVIDPVAWQKVKGGVYNGFSIGGRVAKRVGNVIQELQLTEISLVDRPANPQALFTMVKVEGGQEAVEKAKMNTKERDSLDDSDFAYIDSTGKRHLPINDAAHVRNALARFNQTEFESDSAKSKAKAKILARAKELGIEVSEKVYLVEMTKAGATEADYDPANDSDLQNSIGMNHASMLLDMAQGVGYMKNNAENLKRPSKHLDQAHASLKKAALAELQHEHAKATKKLADARTQTLQKAESVQKIVLNKRNENVIQPSWSTDYFTQMRKAI